MLWRNREEQKFGLGHLRIIGECAGICTFKCMGFELFDLDPFNDRERLQDL